MKNIIVKHDDTGEQQVEVLTKGDKIRRTLLEKDPNHFKKIGSKGGKNSTSRPFKDSSVAREAVLKRWDRKGKIK